MPPATDPRSHRRVRIPCRHAARQVLAVAAVSVALLGCAKADERVTARPATPAAASGPPGADVYARSCARCHGADLQGRSGTPPIDRARLASLGDQRLRITISSGKGKMPAFGGLSAAQVDQLISYLEAVA